MHSSSLTYLELPLWLQEPYVNGVLSLPEAVELWDLWLQALDRGWMEVPARLFPAAQRLHLWETDVDEMGPVQ